MFRLQERFITLNVDVDFCIYALRDGVNAVGAAGEGGRGKLAVPSVFVAEGCDLFRISGHKQVVELRASFRRVPYPSEHGATGYRPQDLAWQTSRSEACRNDAHDAQSDVPGRLFRQRGIKYDGTWLCQKRLSPIRDDFSGGYGLLQSAV